MKEYIIAVWEREIGRLQEDLMRIKDSSLAADTDMRAELQRRVVSEKLTAARAELENAKDRA